MSSYEVQCHDFYVINRESIKTLAQLYMWVKRGEIRIPVDDHRFKVMSDIKLVADSLEREVNRYESQFQKHAGRSRNDDDSLFDRTRKSVSYPPPEYLVPE